MLGDSIARNSFVHSQRPRLDATVQILHLAEAKPGEFRTRLSAAPTMVAVNNHRAIAPGLDFTKPRFEIRQGNGPGALDARLGHFLGAPNIQQEHLPRALQASVQIRRRNLDYPRSFRFRWVESAEALVIDQLGHRRVGTTNRTLGILLEAKLIPLHGQGIVGDKPTRQRAADPRQEFLRFP